MVFVSRFKLLLSSRFFQLPTNIYFCFCLQLLLDSHFHPPIIFLFSTTVFRLPSATSFLFPVVSCFTLLFPALRLLVLGFFASRFTLFLTSCFLHVSVISMQNDKYFFTSKMEKNGWIKFLGYELPVNKVSYYLLLLITVKLLLKMSMIKSRFPFKGLLISEKALTLISTRAATQHSRPH